MAFLHWLKWFVWDSLVCAHAEGAGTLEDMGRMKVFRCRKCGKVLRTV